MESGQLPAWGWSQPVSVHRVPSVKRYACSCPSNTFNSLSLSLGVQWLLFLFYFFLLFSFSKWRYITYFLLKYIWHMYGMTWVLSSVWPFATEWTGSSVHGISQARILECVVISFSAAAAAAKSLQSCLTLCDPVDGSPWGSPIPGILQARTLERVTISFSNAWKWKVKVKTVSRVQLMDCSLPGSSVHGIFQARVLEWGAIAFSNFLL